MTRERIARAAGRRLAQERPAVHRAAAVTAPRRSPTGCTTVADRHGTTPGAVAVAWTLRNPAVDGAITGFRRADQVDPILAAASLELTDEDIDEIEARNG